MHDRKLIRLLKTLSAWEMNHFVDMVHSPYHNKHQRLRDLVSHLGSLHPEYPQESLTAEALHSLLFEGAPFRLQALSDLFSYLSKLLEKFLALEKYQDDTFQQDLYKIQALADKGAEQDYVRSLDKTQADLSSRDHFEQYVLSSEKVTYLARTQNRVPEASIEAAARDLDRYYLENSLRLACERLNRKAVVSQEFDLSLAQHIADYLENRLENFVDEPLILAYYHVYRLLAETKGADTFQTARSVLQQRYLELPEAQLPDLFGYLLNVCIRQINAGETSFRPILLELYEWLLDKEILLEEGWLSPFNFKNMVALGLQLRRLDWVAGFIEDFGFRIQPSFRDQAKTYNLAMLRFEQGDFSEALRLLREKEFVDPFYQLGAKTLLLKAYFETESYEALLSLIGSFSTYLTRNRKLSPVQISRYRNLLKFTRQLLRIKLKTAYQKLPLAALLALKQKILQQGNMTQRDWLLGKIEHMLQLGDA